MAIKKYSMTGMCNNCGFTALYNIPYGFNSMWIKCGNCGCCNVGYSDRELLTKCEKYDILIDIKRIK